MATDWLNDLTTVLPAGALRELRDSYLTEPRGTWRGSAAAVVGRPIPTRSRA